MMLVDDLKKRMNQALKERDEIAKNILGLALGEIQTGEARANRPLRDDEAVALVRKLLKSNEETLGATAPGAAADALKKENALLAAFLPATMSVEQIVAALAPQADAIKAAKNDGQATGIAVKHLKASGAAASGPDVAQAVKQLRGG